MTSRALLVGSQTYGLAGTNNDVALMADTLAARGFECQKLIDDAASRRGIVDAYEALIASTAADETVVVYYSGHGGRSPLTDWQERQRRGERSHLQFIVPFDMEASTETDFRGLLAEELSDLQRRLTARTANVTTILDCCHAGSMSRDPDLLPKVASRDFPVDGALMLLDAIDAGAAPATSLDDSNRLAVRLVACDPLQSAYERASSIGGRHGVLTEQLVLFLREVGEHSVTWRVVADVIRRRVSTSLPMQRPDVEGPADRLLFTTTERSIAGAVPAVADGRGARIEAAELLGVTVGDTFLLRTALEVAVGSATVRAVVDGTAELDVQRRDGAPLTAEAAIAEPLTTSSARPIAVQLSAPMDALVAERLQRTPLLRKASIGERPVATIVDRDGLVVLDPEGFVVDATPAGLDGAGAETAVAIAERVATAERVRALTSGGRHDDLVGNVRVELALHDDEGRHPLPRSGARLYLGDRMSLTITNSSERELYVGLLDVKTNYEVAPVSDGSGWTLPPGETKVVGTADGVEMVADPGVPDDGRERPESLVVVASTKAVDFTLFRTRSPARARGESSELETLLRDVGSGSRGWAVEQQAHGHQVETLDFFLDPHRRPLDGEPPFAVVELPEPALRAARPRSVGAPPARLAVRLVELKVLRNKALFKAAVRLDALVITAAENGGVVATPFTERFPGIADGDLLPADNLRLFLAPVRDFIDIAIWLNRDDRKGQDLAALFEARVNEVGVGEALTVVGGLILAAPHVAVAIAGLGAVSKLVSVGAELVASAVGNEIGLYRTGFLPFEQFGVGRHPTVGRRQAQGIEFAIEIVDPD